MSECLILVPFDLAPLGEAKLPVVEQNANMALSIAHRGFVLQTGQVVLSGKASDLLDTELIRKAYLGETWSPDGPGVVAAPVA